MVVRRRFLSATLAATVATALVAAAAPRVAYGQTDEQRAGARAAADAGLQAYNAKNWSACKDYFTRAQSLIDAPPHLLYIARCSVQLGQLVSGREAYLKIRREVITPDKPQAFQDAKANAETELTALEPRIPYLNIVVTGADGQAVTVKMDGDSVPAALVGIPHPVDPGAHQIEASAGALVAPPKSVTLAEGQHQDVTLALAPAATATVPPAGPTGGPDVSATPPATDNSTPVQPPSGSADTGVARVTHPYRTAGFVAMGVGAAGLVLGGVFFAKSGSDSSSADNLFNQSHCATFCSSSIQSQVKSLDSSSSSDKGLAFVAGGVGIAALGVGIALVLLPKHAASPAQAVTVEPLVGLGSLGLRGSF